MIYVIDGSRIQDMDSFYDEIQQVFCPNLTGFGRNLDALNDILRGGFGTIGNGEKVSIKWKESTRNRNTLGDKQFNVITDIFKSQGHNLQLS